MHWNLSALLPWVSPHTGTSYWIRKFKARDRENYKLDQIREAHAYVEKFHKKGNVAVTILKSWHEFTCPRCWPPDSLLSVLSIFSSCCLLTITCCLLTTAFSVFIYAIFLWTDLLQIFTILMSLKIYYYETVYFFFRLSSYHHALLQLLSLVARKKHNNKIENHKLSCVCRGMFLHSPSS